MRLISFYRINLGHLVHANGRLRRQARGLTMYFVYVLQSLVNKRLYTGSAADVDIRLKQHNAGKSKYTKLTKPFILVYKEMYNSRSEAVRRELFLKSGKGRGFLKTKLGI